VTIRTALLILDRDTELHGESAEKFCRVWRSTVKCCWPHMKIQQLFMRRQCYFWAFFGYYMLRCRQRVRSVKLKFHLARLDSTRHIRRVEPMHFGCVELVEQHSSTCSTRRARQALLAT